MTKLYRSMQICLLFAVAVFLTGASDTDGRYTSLGHKMMCTCGCNQVLIECNHVGCQSSRRMLADLHTDLSRGDSDISILRAFQAEYGPIAMAAPMFTTFNHTVWIAPPLFLLIGIGIIVLLVRKWKRQRVSRPLTQFSGDVSEIHNRIRKETEL
jgi:cytochrome c-type biogenesis protein CcmH/NrfF